MEVDQAPLLNLAAQNPCKGGKVVDEVTIAETFVEMHHLSTSVGALFMPTSSFDASTSSKKCSLSKNILINEPNREKFIDMEHKGNNATQSNNSSNAPTKHTESNSPNDMAEIVERIINSVDSKEAASRESSRAYSEHQNINAKNFEEVFGGPFTSNELSQLSLLSSSTSTFYGRSERVRKYSTCINMKENNRINCIDDNEIRSWASLDEDLLASLTPMLHTHVASAIAIDLIGEGRDVISKGMLANDDLGEYNEPVISLQHWMFRSPKYSGPKAAPLGTLGENKVEPGAGFRRLQTLLSGLQAAFVLLSIMASPGIRLEDDAIEGCVDLIKNHMIKHIIPALSNTGHLGLSLASTSAADDKDGEENPLYNVDVNTSYKVGKKRRKSTNYNLTNAPRDFKSVYIPILSTIGLFGTILERAEALIVFNEIDDRLLFALSAATLSSFTIDASLTVRADTVSLASITQVSAMNLIVSIFRRYPRHRCIIIEDLFPLMLKLPTSKRTLRTFQVKERSRMRPNNNTPKCTDTACVDFNDQYYIQSICVLILLFIQSCTVMPLDTDVTLQEGESDGNQDEDSNNPENLDMKANDISGLNACAAVCNQFTYQLLLRCSHKGEEGGASEFRPILHNLIDDLLLVRLLPEYPAAEMLLLFISRRLGNDLLRASSAPKNAQVEATYLTTAMDALGKITSTIASNARNNRENPFKLPESISLSELESSEEVNRCFCGRGCLDTFMIDCDRCHSWFHGSCVRITKDEVPERWLCDDCTLHISISVQAQAFARGKEVSKILTGNDHVHALRQLLLNHLTRISESMSTPQVERAREFMIATWVKDLTMSKRQSRELGLFDLDIIRGHIISHWSLEGVLLNQPQNSQISNDGIERIMEFLALSSELSLNMPKLLGVLLRLMSDDMASLRKLSVKAILQVVNVDPVLMVNPSVRKEVSRCFHDDAISVREAAVTLVGEYVIKLPSLALAFHSSLLERMLDRGVSVRKRVIKIFRDILLTHPAYGGRATAMHCMLQRAADRKEDDTVRDLIYETFYTLWFSSTAYSMSVSNLTLSSDSQSNFTQIALQTELYCREAVNQMVEVIKISGSPELLTVLFTGLLFGFSEGEKDKKLIERKHRQEEAGNQCKSLVSSLIEILLVFEETRENREVDIRELVAILSTFGVFSQTFPELLVPHIDTLIPYLKGDNLAKQYESKIVSTICNIISRLSPFFTTLELNRLIIGELPTDLVNIVYKFPSDAVSSAIETLCKLSKDHDACSSNIQGKKLLKVAVQFYSYLLKTADSTTDFKMMKKSVRDNVKRALSVLGSICRFYECNPINDECNIDLANISVITDATLLTFTGNAFSNACFSIFLEYLNRNDKVTTCLAFRAMTGIFISRPRVVLIAEQLGILSYVMSEEAPSCVQLESLKCWGEILLAEEKRIESGDASTKMAAQKEITVSKKISGDQDGDSCISGSVLTRHTSRLYELTLSKDEKVRFMIVELIGHLLRQGLINPMETVPYLLALQGDIKSPSTRSIALKLLITEGDKRPDMLNQRIQAGIVKSFKFQREVYSRDDNGGIAEVTALLESKGDGATVDTKTIFDEVIKESSIRNKKAQRHGLYKSIIGLFENNITFEFAPEKSKNDHETDRLPLLAFASQILAHLPYSCTSDVLFVIYHVLCITTLEGNDLLVAFAKLLGNDVIDPNASEDELEMAAKLKDPKASTFLSKLRKKNDFNPSEFAELCDKASSLNFLLRLKIFLCHAYNLSEARVTEYLPSEKENVHEKGISIANGTAKFTVTTQSVYQKLSGSKDHRSIDWNVAIRTYATFRILMREGDVQGNTLQFDKLVSSKKGRKRKGIQGQHEDTSTPCAASAPLLSTARVSPD